jgi:peroxiredoxin
MRRLLAALTAILVLTGCGADPAPVLPTGLQVVPVGDRQPAPALQGEKLDGTGAYDLAADRGNVVVLNFWGSWCGPCVAEADDLVQAYASTKESGVRFVGINVRDVRGPAVDFIAEHQVTYPNVFDPSSKVALGFQVPPTTIPATLILDRQHRVAVVARRAVVLEELRTVLTQLAQEHG